MWSTTLLVVLAAAGSVLSHKYVVPEPSITTLCPQGIQLAIPDDRSINSVQFFISFDKPGPKGSGRVFQKNGQWVYSNSNLDLKAGDLVKYTITVDANGSICTKEGTAAVSEGPCDDDLQQHIPLTTDNLGTEEESLAKTGSLKSSMKSSYSMFKTVDSKPITRSSTTTSSGSYFMKPTGEVETSGYKTSSNYDSTRREGEQWQHSKSELSQSEIDELKRLHGNDFMSLPAFAHLHDLHGNHGSIGQSGNGGSSHSYRYSSSSTTSTQSRPTYISTSSINQLGQSGLGDIPISHPSYGATTLETGQSHIQIPDNSNYDVPLIRPSQADTDSRLVRQGQSNYNVRPSGGSYTSEYQRTVTTQNAPAYPSLNENPNIRTPGEVSYIRTPEPKGTAHFTKKTEIYEMKAPQKTVVVPQPLSYTYTGEIFNSKVRPSSPDTCKTADYGFRTAPQIDLVQLERSVNEVQCLAVLAENSLKSDIRSLKESNAQLIQRIQDIEHEFRRFKSECRCSGY